MEADERPQKRRRLEHSALDDQQAMANHSVSNHVPNPQMSVDAGERADDFESTVADATETNEPDANDTDFSASEDHASPETHVTQLASAPPLSKNALKKIRKKEQWDAGRDDRKLKRKQKIAEKRMRKRTANEEARAAAAARAAEEESNRKDKPSRTMHTRLPITFVIDCGFDNLMTEREMISLGSQLTRSYSDNHKAPFQAHFFVSSWGGKLKERFNTVLGKHHENWKGVTFVEEDFVAAAERAKELMTGKMGGKLGGALTAAKDNEGGVGDHFELLPEGIANGEVAVMEDDAASGEPHLAPGDSDKEKSISVATNPSDKPECGKANEPGVTPNGHVQGPRDAPAEEPDADSGLGVGKEGEIVYLSSDSPHVLNRLQPYSTYIVGGLVDKNRHKGICYKTALERGIKTAKLPIGEFMEMQSRFVLATNHVVEIMVRWLECGDWGEAFVEVMPKRKGGVLKASRGIKQDVHGAELEAADSSPGSGNSGGGDLEVEQGNPGPDDSKEDEAVHLQGGVGQCPP